MSTDAISIMIALGILLVAFIGALFGASKYVNSEINRVRELGIAECKAVSEGVSKQLHTFNNANTAAVGKLETQLQNLDRTTVRREEITGLESRITAALTKMESKMDTMTDKVASIPSISAGMDKLQRHVDERVDQLVDRLDGRNFSGR